MAWDDSINWRPDLQQLWENTFQPYESTGILDDPWLAPWFEGGWMTGGLTDEQRRDLQAEFMIYVHDTYGVDFDDVWDWDAFREAYGGD